MSTDQDQQQEKTYHIVKLNVENVKRLSAVEITPTGNLVVIGGKNGAGKSTVLDSIMYAISGGKSIPDRPVRAGQERGHTVVVLGDPKSPGDGEFKVTRNYAVGGGSTLLLQAMDGAKYSSPQAILNGLFGSLSFDPERFARMDAGEQLKVIKELVGLDFSELDASRQKLYDDRTDVGRDVKKKLAVYQSIEVPEGAPTEPVKATDLADQLQKAKDTNAANKVKRDAVTVAINEHNAAVSTHVKIQDDIADLERQLAQKRVDLEHAAGLVREMELAKEKAQDAVKDLKDVAEQPILNAMGEVDQKNEAYRKWKDKEDAKREKDELQKQYDALTKQIEKIDQQKQIAIQTAKYPIKGLGMNDAGVTMNGIPFSQASAAEKLKVSIAIGAALNPKLKVILIRDGSLLDKDSVALVAKIAKEHNLQVWMERVTDGTDCSVLIEDGTVKAEYAARQPETEELGV